MPAGGVAASVVAGGDLGRRQRPGQCSRRRPGGVQFGRRPRTAPRLDRGGLATTGRSGACGSGRRLPPRPRTGPRPGRGEVGGAGSAVEARTRWWSQRGRQVDAAAQRALEDQQIPIVRLNGADSMAAANSFHEAVLARALVHPPDPMVAGAVGAVSRTGCGTAATGKPTSTRRSPSPSPTTASCTPPSRRDRPTGWRSKEPPTEGEQKYHPLTRPAGGLAHSSRCALAPIKSLYHPRTVGGGPR